MTTTGSEGDAEREPAILTRERVTTAVVKGTVPVSDLRNFFDTSFRTLAETMSAQSVTPTSPAFGLYHGQPADTADLEVGFVVDREVEPDGDVAASSLPGGRVAQLVHVGSFDELASSWERLKVWIDEQGLTRGQVMWEVYVSEPSPAMDPQDLRTELNWPVSD